MKNLRTICCLCTLCVTCENALCKDIQILISSVRRNRALLWSHYFPRRGANGGNCGNVRKPGVTIAQHCAEKGELCVDSTCFS
jgi:hypothetical protein